MEFGGAPESQIIAAMLPAFGAPFKRVLVDYDTALVTEKDDDAGEADIRPTFTLILTDGLRGGYAHWSPLVSRQSMRPGDTEDPHVKLA